jgi:TRAP-type C4-dicarboxylate transport system permease small subunit
MTTDRRIAASSRFWRGFDLLIQAMAVLGAVIFVFATVLVLTEVSSRYFLRRPILGAIEITEYCLVWITFLAAPWIQSQGANVKVEFLVHRLSSRNKNVLCGVTALLASVACAILTYAGIVTVWAHHEMGYALSTPLRPPSAPLVAIIPISTSLLAIQFAREFVSLWHGARAE